MKAKRILLMAMVAMLTLGIASCESKAKKESEIARQQETERVEKERMEKECRRNADPYRDSGWSFLRNRLKSPSTASLVGYVSPNEEPTRKLANDLGSSINVATYQVDAQNGFGAMIRSNFYVFFNGSCCW